MWRAALAGCVGNVHALAGEAMLPGLTVRCQTTKTRTSKRSCSGSVLHVSVTKCAHHVWIARKCRCVHLVVQACSSDSMR